jgi:hypothetical protein
LSEEALETLVTEDMRGIVGKLMRQATSYPITASDIRKWAIAVYYPDLPPRLHWDEEYAATTRWGGIVAPQEFNPFGAAWMAKDPPPTSTAGTSVGATGRSGAFESELGVDPPPYRAVLQSRIIATYSGVRMRPGDIIRSETRISEYFERQGKMGLQLYTTVSDDLYNQRDEWIKRLDTVFLRYR